MSQSGLGYGVGPMLMDSLIPPSVADIRAHSLQPFKDDITEWLQKFLDAAICVSNFMDHFDNGVILCQLAETIEQKTRAIHPNEAPREGLPQHRMPPNVRANRGSWYAHSNVVHFLDWCQAHGVPADILCDHDDIENHRNERKVLLTLLAVSNICRRHGLPCCELTLMEEQINYRMTDRDPRKMFGPLKYYRTENVFELDQSKWNLDEVIKLAIGEMGNGLHVQKLDTGTYNISGRLVHIKLLRQKYVMVYDSQLLGKWDTLQNYLVTRRPACLCF